MIHSIYSDSIKDFLDEKVDQFNNLSFIENDPISIPHEYTLKQDIEISGFFAATLAWGQRITIINKCHELLSLMDNSPYEFILNHQESDLKRFINFKHRTFNVTDTLYFIYWLNHFYNSNESLEHAFSATNMESSLIGFRNNFFDLPDYAERTKKHVATPANKSACKRLNMFLRWMVRSDDKGVDFGIWKTLQPSDLICPCDVHVGRVARKLGLITRKQTDWLTAMELTNNLRKMNAVDPVRYDFALFGLGVVEKF